MVNYRFLLILISTFIVVTSCSPSKKDASDQEIPKDDSVIAFDSIKAKALGADDYGMKKYVMAFLKRGPNRDRTKEEAAKLQSAHMENIGRLADMGKLVVAGPFLHDGELRGIYIFNVETVEEAEALTNSDPAIKAGSLIMELYPWYGSAAMMEVNEIHNKIAKIKF